MRLNFRQGIIRQNPVYLFATPTGVNLTIANNIQLEVSIAHRDKNYHHVEAVDVVNAWTLQPADVVGNPAWLYIDLDPITAERTFGYTRQDLIVSAVTPVSPVNDQHWFDITTTTMKVYNAISNIWVEKIRIIIARYEDTSITAYSGSGISQVDITAISPIYQAGSILYDVLGKAIVTSEEVFLTSESEFYVNAGLNTSINLESEIVYAEAEEHIGAFQVVVYSNYSTTGTYGTIKTATYEDVDTSVLAMTTRPFNAGEVGTVITIGNIRNNTWDWLGQGVQIGAKLYLGVGAQAGTLVPTDPAVADPLLEPKGHVARVLGRDTVQFLHSYSSGVLSTGGGSGGPIDPIDLPVATTDTYGAVQLYNHPVVTEAAHDVATFAMLSYEISNLSFSFTATDITVAVVPESSDGFSPAIIRNNVQEVLNDLNDLKFDKTGGIFTGDVWLGSQIDDNLVVTKKYVDDAVAAGGGGGSVSVMNEGVLLNSAVTTFNFIGPDVEALNATGVPGQVDIYLPPVNFSGSGSSTPNLALIGSTVNNVTLNWSYTAPPTTQSFTGPGSGPLLPTDTVLNLNSLGLVSNTQWQFTAESPFGNTVFNINLSFANNIYHGKNVNPIINETEIEALTSILSNSATRTYSVPSSGTPEYFYVCYPISVSDPTNWNDANTGFSVPFEQLANVTVTNSEGHVEDYRVQRSFNAFASSASIVVS